MKNVAKLNKKAFTLVEMLVVVLIIGILAAIAVPKYQKAVWTSKYSTIKNLTNSIAQAEELYYIANGQYAPLFTDLDISIPTPNNCVFNNYNTYVCFYDFGKCRLRVERNYIECILFKNNNSFISYQKNLKRHSYPNKQVCFAFNRETLPTKICQAETGKTIPYGSGPDQDSNYYEGYLYK